MHRIMRGGLVSHDIRLHATLDEFREDFSRIADQRDGLCLACLGPGINPGQRFVEAVGLLIDIPGAQTEIGAGFVAFHGETAGTSHHRRQRLRAAHAAETAGQNPLAGEVAVKMLATGFDKGFVSALNDALRADIDPRTGGHLAIHGETLLIQFVEMIPGCPMRHEVGIGDQNTRRILVGAENANRLARLHQQGFVFIECLEGRNDAVEIVPGAGSAANAAIDHQLMRTLGHIGVEIVHQHAQRRFGQPALGVEFVSARRPDFALIMAWVRHGVLLRLSGRAQAFPAAAKGF